MRERFEQRLFRIFAQAGYSPAQLLTITPEEMVEIPGITVPNIRAALLDLCRMEENKFPLSQWQDSVRYLTGIEKDFASIEEIKAFLRNEVKP